ncbi:ImmA/IrrE family metallo-endopeptidase [Amycolatopsis sp. H6(2020)]|nr:ImmA/IrrE family metallo-endopeptidase [Amycolatopsis sp. H6(2020)]
MDDVPTSIPALVEPAVLRWARVTIGLMEVAAARRIGVPDDRVTQWETGEAQPTIAQLKKAATVYNRALGVFFLAEPPAAFDTLRDFRRLPEAGGGEWSPDLHAEYRRAHQQRDNLLELYDLDDEQPPDDWRLSTGDSDEGLAARARETLLRLSPLTLTVRSTAYDHVNTWAAGLERAGVLVLASSRGRVQTTEMRAFSLHFDQLPVIMVNGADSPRGRLFSLLHEYGHLLLHTEGLCDVTADLKATTPERQLEARCNALAAAMLMPAAAVLRRPEVQARAEQQDTWTYAALRDAAAPFGVSAEAFLRRLLTLGRVSQPFYEARRAEFLKAYEADASTRATTGGDWYRNTARDLGKGYVRQVTDAHRRRMIDTYTAATYLNAKAGQIDKLAEAAAVREVV